MTIDMIITLAVVIFMVALIISDKLPFGAPPMIACALLVVLNQATIAEAYSGFVDSNVIMICSFMVCMAGLQKTTFIAKIKNLLGVMAGKGGMRNYAILLLLIMFIGNFISGTAYYAMVLSIVATIPYKKELPNSRILLPAAMATGFGGWIPINVAFMVGLMDSLLESSGVVGYSISFGTYAIIRAVVAAVFFVWAMIGFRLLPDHDINADGSNSQQVETKESAAPKLSKTQEMIVYIGFIAVIVCLLFNSSLPNDVGYGVPALVGGIFLCAGIINFKEFLGQWFSPLCVMMAGVIGVAAAKTRVYLTGFSNGASITREVGTTCPEWFAGLSPWNGPVAKVGAGLIMQEAIAPSLLSAGYELPYFVYVGDKDATTGKADMEAELGPMRAVNHCASEQADEIRTGENYYTPERGYKSGDRFHTEIYYGLDGVERVGYTVMKNMPHGAIPEQSRAAWEFLKKFYRPEGSRKIFIRQQEENKQQEEIGQQEEIKQQGESRI